MWLKTVTYKAFLIKREQRGLIVTATAMGLAVAGETERHVAIQ